MEIELKYRLKDKGQIEEILSDERVLECMDPDSREELHMEAAYFDTSDRRLNREGITFRVRRENDKLVGTLKWNGTSEEGMHVREEINVPNLEESKFERPDPEVFCQSDMCENLKELIGQRTLEREVFVDYDRTQVRLDTGKVICELSFDHGKVFRNEEEGTILEMEIELYSGDREEMEKFGAYLAEKYGLIAENKSKFRQGLELGR